MASFQDINTIANDTVFQGRCLYALEVAAIGVMSENNTASHHQQRVNYAVQIINGDVPGLRVALAVLTNSTIAAEATTASLPGATSSVPDGDLQFAVNTLYNALAGIGS